MNKDPDADGHMMVNVDNMKEGVCNVVGFHYDSIKKLDTPVPSDCDARARSVYDMLSKKNDGSLRLAFIGSEDVNVGLDQTKTVVMMAADGHLISIRLFPNSIDFDSLKPGAIVEITDWKVIEYTRSMKSKEWIYTHKKIVTVVCAFAAVIVEPCKQEKDCNYFIMLNHETIKLVSLLGDAWAVAPSEQRYVSKIYESLQDFVKTQEYKEYNSGLFTRAGNKISANVVKYEFPKGEDRSTKKNSKPPPGTYVYECDCKQIANICYAEEIPPEKAFSVGKGVSMNYPFHEDNFIHYVSWYKRMFPEIKQSCWGFPSCIRLAIRKHVRELQTKPPVTSSSCSNGNKKIKREK